MRLDDTCSIDGEIALMKMLGLASFHALKLSQGRTLGSPGAPAKPDDGENSKDVLQREGFLCEMYHLIIRRWKGNVVVIQS